MKISETRDACYDDNDVGRKLSSCGKAVLDPKAIDMPYFCVVPDIFEALWRSNVTILLNEIRNLARFCLKRFTIMGIASSRFVWRIFVNDFETTIKPSCNSICRRSIPQVSRKVATEVSEKCHFAFPIPDAWCFMTAFLFKVSKSFFLWCRILNLSSSCSGASFSESNVRNSSTYSENALRFRFIFNTAHDICDSSMKQGLFAHRIMVRGLKHIHVSNFWKTTGRTKKTLSKWKPDLSQSSC